MVDGLSMVSASRAGPECAGKRRRRLLVSVRNADEARAALAGGADIIDVKEPQRGALGMADTDVIAGVAAAINGVSPVSAALGELHEWKARPGQEQGLSLTVDGLSTALCGLSFVKLGLAGAGAGRSQDWVQSWLNVRQAIDRVVGCALPWVAVAYADAPRAAAPPVDDVIAAAVATRCRGVLIDTCDKRSASLIDLCSTVDLQRWSDALRSTGLFLALAGRLSGGDLSEPALEHADIVGVRSAACTSGDRHQSICAERVAALRASMEVGSGFSV